MGRQGNYRFAFFPTRLAAFAQRAAKEHIFQTRSVKNYQLIGSFLGALLRNVNGEYQSGSRALEKQQTNTKRINTITAKDIARKSRVRR